MLAEGPAGVNRARRQAPPGPAYVACGWHAALAFLSARPGAVVRVMLARDAPDWVERRASEAGVFLERCETRELDHLAAGVPHQGIVAVGQPPPQASADRLDPVRDRVVLALDAVTDPRNVGALVRAAEGAGVAAVVMARDRAPGLTPALVKAAAGAVEWLPLVRVANLARALADLRTAGYWVIGLDGGATVELYGPDAIPGLPCVVVVGAEGEGIRPLIRRTCHRLVRIPMAGQGDSLNVSVAAAVALFEIRRALRAGHLR